MCIRDSLDSGQHESRERDYGQFLDRFEQCGMRPGTSRYVKGGVTSTTKQSSWRSISTLRWPRVIGNIFRIPRTALAEAGGPPCPLTGFERTPLGASQSKEVHMAKLLRDPKNVHSAGVH